MFFDALFYELSEGQSGEPLGRLAHLVIDDRRINRLLAEPVCLDDQLLALDTIGTTIAGPIDLNRKNVTVRKHRFHSMNRESRPMNAF